MVNVKDIDVKSIFIFKDRATHSVTLATKIGEINCKLEIPKRLIENLESAVIESFLKKNGFSPNNIGDNVAKENTNQKVSLLKKYFK